MGRWGPGFWDTDITDQCRRVYTAAVAAGKTDLQARTAVIADAGYRMEHEGDALLIRTALRKLSAGEP